MLNSSIYGLDPVLYILQNALKYQSVSHAYLFVGNHGIGKSTLACRFSQFMNCKTLQSCGKCPSCELFKQKKHPDFLVIKPDGNFIKLAQIHTLQNQLSLRPSIANKRTILIKDAEKMNQESANAFLKTLEEPQKNTLLILTSTNEDLLPETILSRCQKILFPPLDKIHLKKLFSEHYPVKSEHLEFAVSFGNGGIRKDFLQQVEVLYLLRKDTFSILEQLNTEQIVEHFIYLEQIVKKNIHIYFIEFCMSWVHDLLVIKQEASESFLYNLEFQHYLKKQSNIYSIDQLNNFYNLLIETERSLQMFANKLLALESMLIQIKQIKENKNLLVI